MILLKRIFLIIVFVFAGAQHVPAQAPNERQDYNSLLAAVIAKQKAIKRTDVVQEVVHVITAGAGSSRANDVVKSLKESFPMFEPGTPLRLYPEMTSALIKKGKEYERLLSATDKLLQFTGLKGIVIPVLYRSEEPFVGFSYPNGLIFSTRMLALLDDEEIEALSAHELGHLIGREVFKSVVEADDKHAIRIFELFCDGIGATTLAAMGKDPRRLYTGLSKQFQAYEVGYGVDIFSRKNPSMDTRNRLNKELIKLFAVLAKG